MKPRNVCLVYFLAFAAGFNLMQCQADNESTSQGGSITNPLLSEETEVVKESALLLSEVVTPALVNVPLGIVTQSMGEPTSISVPPQSSASHHTTGHGDDTVAATPIAPTTTSAVSVEPSFSFHIDINNSPIPTSATTDKLASVSPTVLAFSQSYYPADDESKTVASKDVSATFSRVASDLTTTGPTTISPPLPSTTVESNWQSTQQVFTSAGHDEDQTSSTSAPPSSTLSTSSETTPETASPSAIGIVPSTTGLYEEQASVKVSTPWNPDLSPTTETSHSSLLPDGINESLTSTGITEPTIVTDSPKSTVETVPSVTTETSQTISASETDSLSSTGLTDDSSTYSAVTVGMYVTTDTEVTSMLAEDTGPESEQTTLSYSSSAEEDVTLLTRESTVISNPPVPETTDSVLTSERPKNTTVPIEDYADVTTMPSSEELVNVTVPATIPWIQQRTTTMPGTTEVELTTVAPTNESLTVPLESVTHVTAISSTDDGTTQAELTIVVPSNETLTVPPKSGAQDATTISSTDDGTTEAELTTVMPTNESLTMLPESVAHATTISSTDEIVNVTESVTIPWIQPETTTAGIDTTTETKLTTLAAGIPLLPGSEEKHTASAESFTTGSSISWNDTDMKPGSKSTPKPTTTTLKPIGNEILKTDKVPVVTILTSQMATSILPKTALPITPPSNEIIPVPKPSDKVLPTVYIEMKLKMTWAAFCSHLEGFQARIAKLLVDHRKQEISLNQVEITDTTKCFSRGFWRHRRSMEILIDFYMVDPKGTYNEELTNMVADILDDHQLLLDVMEHTIFDGKVISVKVYGNRQKPLSSRDPETKEQAIGVGITVGIIIATIVGLCVIGFVIFQIAVMRKRRSVKKMRYMYDSPYSLSAHSINEAIQLTGVSRREDRFAYINPGLVTDDKDLTSNTLTMEGMGNVLKDLDVIEDEFLMLPNIIPKLTDVPLGAEDKNRYANVIPIPETRVNLHKDSDEDGADYINANFVRGHLCCPECYIATQAPMEHTKGDFWQMVWDQQSQVIIMLTGLEEHGIPKCAEYWPNTVGGDVVRVYDFFEVVKRKREVKPEWILSILKLKNLKTNQTRDVVHFWMTAWPIDGMPDCRTVINFLLEARPYMEYGAGPTVVHCSPGNGRTGTLLAIDIQMLSYDDTKMVDILSCLHRLREDRAGAVQTKEQYIFIYKVVYEYARMLNSRHPSNASSMASIYMAT